MILAVYTLSEKGRMVHHCQTVNVTQLNSSLSVYLRKYSGVKLQRTMSQLMVLIIKIRMLQRTRRNTIGRRSTQCAL